MTKNKTICDWDKRDIEKHIDQILKLVEDPKYICRKCARIAHKEESLCKPAKIKRIKHQN